MRTIIWFWSVVLCAGIALVGQLPSAALAGTPAKVVIGLNSDVRNFDPVNTLDTTTDRVITHIYEYLFVGDLDMKVTPLLAESARSLDDLTWEVKLRKNVKFSDGEPFNADTVKANLEYIVKKENNSAELLAGMLYMEPTLRMEQKLGDIITRLWAGELACDDTDAVLAQLRALTESVFAPGLDPLERLRRAETSSKAIYIHSHMDEDTFDTDRIRQCPVGIREADGTNIPSCAYNTVYRDRDARFARHADGHLEKAT